MPPRPIVVALLVSLVAGLSSVNSASADALTDKCLDSYAKVQSERRDGFLLEAKGHAIDCAADACPKAITRECTKWISEIEESLPTVVFDARTPAGQDATDVRVLVDGKTFVERLDGRAVPIDPGQHTVRFEPPGSPPTEVKIVSHEGEKSRRLAVVLGRPGEVPQPHNERPIPAGFWAFGTLSLVGFGTFATAGIVGLKQKSSLDFSGCSPSCDPKKVDAMTRSFMIADMGLGVGAVAAGAALWIVLTRPTIERRHAELRLSPSLGGLVLDGEF